MAWPEVGNGWQSPRISFSVDLSQIDRTSPEKRIRVGPADIIHSPEFEFCTVSKFKDGRDIAFGETLMSADELFVDGKILPQISAPKAQPLTIARHLSLESSSPIRSASFPSSKASGAENGGFKSSNRMSGRWKEMFKLSNRDYFCATSKEAEEDGNGEKPPVSSRSRWPFSRSGGESRGNGLFCALPFSRSKSAVERKSRPCSEPPSCYRSKSVGAQSAFKETEALVSGSKPAVTTDLKDVKKGPPDLPRHKGSPGRTRRSSSARSYGRGSPGRGSGRFVVRNSKTLDSPRPGKPMADGLLKSHCNVSGVSMKVNPVLNVPAYIGPKKGRLNLLRKSQNTFIFYTVYTDVKV
ncbi:hypothetical protein SUGI_0121530 [Cryptomeria japonica]|nr:hypothetical protein SUGI_0121530 [Cryptomeria japonica]